MCHLSLPCKREHCQGISPSAVVLPPTILSLPWKIASMLCFAHLLTLFDFNSEIMTSSRLTVVINCKSECAQVSHIHPRRTLWPQRVLFPNLVGAGAFVVVLSVVGRGVVVGRGRKLQPKDWLTEKRSRISSRAPGNILGLGEQEEHLAWQPLTRDCCDHPLSPSWVPAP